MVHLVKVHYIQKLIHFNDKKFYTLFTKYSLKYIQIQSGDGPRNIISPFYVLAFIIKL
jgi:hypothetical protein